MLSTLCNFFIVCGMLAACKKNFQQVMKTLVEHRFFQRGILTAILINTLSMSVEYHNQVLQTLYKSLN